MQEVFSHDFYYTVLTVMAALAVVVFIALHKVTAGYGMTACGGRLSATVSDGS